MSDRDSLTPDQKDILTIIEASTARDLVTPQELPKEAKTLLEELDSLYPEPVELKDEDAAFERFLRKRPRDY